MAGVLDGLSNSSPPSNPNDSILNEDEAPGKSTPHLVEQVKASVDRLNAEIAAQARDAENSKAEPEATHSNYQNTQKPVYDGPWVSRPIKRVVSADQGSQPSSGLSKINSEKLYDPASPDFDAITECETILAKERAVTLEKRKRASESSELASVEDRSVHNSSG
ncbi:hypothetical protein GLAREA_05858 [Glarea lozoyensis ATCC 20868]|uniref:Uncharacterized protein n=1 Tax=Glarea lozoyensis (strain ATCC 20868 / MF5171) TaxID=1116229 RepID=S3DLE2_GLAL2|nr:uncharacterized protein GLAREA_05858 [Glarea lozoyensis ATCC 20868]EPE32846.1 hypothetical protein GLAREA_05858 [Glarea lozoyensis ATCC 20868]